MDEHADIAVIGAGAAGLMAAIHAARAAPGARVLAFDGARTIGAKILVAGGGRCNVTHDHVDERAFAGSSPAAIRTVLRRFSVDDTIAFFRAEGVELKREETGKLFPVTDRARTVLDALLTAARTAGVELHHPWRVERLEGAGDAFVLGGPAGTAAARRVILAPGGRSLPRTGSDGHGYALARGLGHTTTARIMPALVPLVLADGHFIRDLKGVATPVTVAVHAGTGRTLRSFTGDALCTHFGLSGPVVLDASRHLLDARADDPAAHLSVNWLPGETFETVDAGLLAGGRAGVGTFLAARLPQRLARALCGAANVDPATGCRQLTRPQRRALARIVSGAPVPVTGSRGFTFAEVTAGGVPLDQVRLATMESRRCPGLHLAGEICDVDGRIGGYNFQWAWASGFVAGVAAAAAFG